MESGRLVLCTVLEGFLLGDEQGKLRRGVGLEAAKGEGMTVQLETGFQERRKSAGAPGIRLDALSHEFATGFDMTYGFVWIKEVRMLDIIVDSKILG